MRGNNVMQIFENGTYRELTEEEIQYWSDNSEPSEENVEPLKAMIQSMSTATTLAEMRAAAKQFLESTEQ